MTSIELLIADALVPADFVPELLRDMSLPALDILAAQGSARELPAPHQDLVPAWLAWPLRHIDQVNVALGMSRTLEVPLASGMHRFMARPIHFDIGQHGLVLADPAHLDIAPGEQLLLRDAIARLLESAGVLVAGSDASSWLLDFPGDWNLRAALSELALHEEVLPWMPQGDDARRWRRISTEIEMVLHDHTLNDIRHARGALPISGLWLSGNSSSQQAPLLEAHTVAGVPPWLAGWPLDVDSSHHIEGLAQLSAPYFDQDWSAFRNALTGIDERLMRHLNALRAGEIGRLGVVFSGTTWLREVMLRRADLYKFWRRGKAFELFDLPE